MADKTPQKPAPAAPPKGAEVKKPDNKGGKKK